MTKIILVDNPNLEFTLKSEVAVVGLGATRHSY